MNPATNQKPPAKPQPSPFSTWKVGEGKRGLEGSVKAVKEELAKLDKAPKHFIEALQTSIEASVEGTEHNFVVIRANGSINKTDGINRHIVMLHIETSKKLL